MRDKLFDHEVRILDTLVKFLVPATWRVLLVGNGSIGWCYNNMFNFFIYVVSKCDVYTSERTIETLSWYSTLSKSQTDNTLCPLLAPTVVRFSCRVVSTWLCRCNGRPNSSRTVSSAFPLLNLHILLVGDYHCSPTSLFKSENFVL